MVAMTWVHSAILLTCAGLPLCMFVREDIRKWRVKDTTLALVILGSLLGGTLEIYAGVPWYQPLIGGALFLGSALAVREFGFMTTGADAFGEADLVLVFSAGVLLGWKAILIFWISGSLLGVAYYLGMSFLRKRKGRRPRRRVPAGPGFATAEFALLALSLAGLYQGFPFSQT